MCVSLAHRCVYVYMCARQMYGYVCVCVCVCVCPYYFYTHMRKHKQCLCTPNSSSSCMRLYIHTYMLHIHKHTHTCIHTYINKICTNIWTHTLIPIYTYLVSLWHGVHAHILHTHTQGPNTPISRLMDTTDACTCFAVQEQQLDTAEQMIKDIIKDTPLPDPRPLSKQVGDDGWIVRWVRNVLHAWMFECVSVWVRGCLKAWICGCVQDTCCNHVRTLIEFWYILSRHWMMYVLNRTAGKSRMQCCGLYTCVDASRGSYFR